MHASIVARSYAETLFSLAERNGGDRAIDAFGDSMLELSSVLRENPRVREFLRSPRVEAEAKKDALRKALQGSAPELFVRFVLVVIEKRRAALLDEIAEAYGALVDQARDRTRAHIVLAYDPDEALRREITTALERMLKRTVIPEFHVDRSLLGGIVVRVGDQVLDGSVRRRSTRLRRRLLTARIPALADA